MAEIKTNLPPGWAVVENDGTVVESTEQIDEATEIEIHNLEQLRATLKEIEDRVASGKIYGIAFAFVGPEGSSAGYGWTDACNEFAPLVLANVDLLRDQIFYNWKHIVLEEE